MRTKIAVFACSALLLVILLPASPAFCQTFYMHGDANSDGWCNWADLIAIQDYLRGVQCPSFSVDGADANGNGSVDILDLTYIADFLRNGGPAPLGASACPIITCDPNQLLRSFIELVQVSDSTRETATFRLLVATHAILSEANFSLSYIPNTIADFSVVPLTSDPVYISPARDLDGYYNVIAVTVDCYNNGQGRHYDDLTPVLDLVLNKAPDAQNTRIDVVEDPIFGPPRFFFGTEDTLGCAISCPAGPLQPVGDMNGNGQVNGIDITYFVRYLKGGPKPVGRYFWSMPVDWDY